MNHLVVAYDDQCGLCMRFARLVARCDRSRRIVADSAHWPRHEKLKSVPDRLSALTAWDEEGQRYLRGFPAVAAIVQRLPGAGVIAPVLHLLDRTGWGDYLYARVASRRRCAKP